MAPEVVFGTGFVGTPLTEFQDADALNSILDVLKDHNIVRLDTAARYPPMYPGRAEEILGNAIAPDHAFVIDTKVFASNLKDPSGDLSLDAINASISESLMRLKVDSVDILYAHLPDPETPIEDQVVAFNAQIDAGRCKQYGLSNHSVDQVRAMLQVCEERGLRKPAVYQGDYNLLTRGMEAELLPLLRQHGMRYIAYRPLAAGFLTGKLVTGAADGTRMGRDSPISASYQQVYGSPILHTAMKDFTIALEQYHLSPIEVALRWVYHHSALSDRDGMILGVRSVRQLQQDMRWIEQGPLPSDVVAVAENVWEKLRESRGRVL